MPLITTDVGGIPEIVAGTDTPLVRPGDIAALAGQMRAFLASPKPFLDRAVRLQAHVAKRLTVERMTNDVVEFYLSSAWGRRRAEAPAGRAPFLNPSPRQPLMLVPTYP